MLKKILTFLVIGWICAFEVPAQDPQFSQFYAAPLYLNPGFTGATLEHRFTLNNRIQWPALPQAFTTYAFSYDYNMRQLNSGFGIMAMTDKAGSADLRSTTIAVSYAYKVQLGNGWIASPGIQFGGGIRTLDYNKLVFGDQLAFGSPDTPTLDPKFGDLENNSYFDFSSGLFIYNKAFWFGVSAYHMNEPNQSVIDEVSVLPMKFSIHSGVRIDLFPSPTKGDRISSIAPSFIYKKQGKFDQLDLGFHFHYNPIMAGVWYRGIPIQQSVDDNFSRDAISILFGLRFDKFDVGYSYDVTISELGPNTGGAHELSLMYQFSNWSRKKKKPVKFVPCPTY